MVDILNNSETDERPQAILDRYEDQIRQRLSEKDIIRTSVHVYSIVSLWCASFEKATGFDDPYEYLEHRMGMRRSTGKVYKRIGHALERHREEISEVKLDEISTPYMLLFLEKALRNHHRNEVVSALTSLSYRHFIHFANQYTRLPEPERTGTRGKSKESGTPILNREEFQQYKSRLRKAYDQSMEVLVVGVPSQQHWDHIVAELKRLQIRAIPAPENAADIESAKDESSARSA